MSYDSESASEDYGRADARPRGRQRRRRQRQRESDVEDSRSYQSDATDRTNTDDDAEDPPARSRRTAERTRRNRRENEPDPSSESEPDSGDSGMELLPEDEQNGPDPDAASCEDCDGCEANACNGLLREYIFISVGSVLFLLALALITAQNLDGARGGRCWARMKDWIVRSHPCMFEKGDGQGEANDEVDYSVTQCCDRACAGISGAEAITRSCSSVREPVFAVTMSGAFLTIGLFLLVFGSVLLVRKIKRHGKLHACSPACICMSAVCLLLVGLAVLLLGFSMVTWPLFTNRCTPFGGDAMTVRLIGASSYQCCADCGDADDCECKDYESVAWAAHTLWPAGSITMALGVILVSIASVWIWSRHRINQRALQTNVVMIGWPGAGKTSLLNRFARGSDARREDRDTVTYAEALPTYGTQTLTLKQWSAGAEHQHIAPAQPRTLTFFDIGGKTEWGEVAMDLPPRISAIAFVVDGRDHTTLHSSGRLLAALLDHQPLADTPLCIFVNKHDGYGHDAITAASLTNQWDLYTLRGRRWNILECSAFEGVGVHEGLMWIMNQTWQPQQIL